VEAKEAAERTGWRRRNGLEAKKLPATGANQRRQPSRGRTGRLRKPEGLEVSGQSPLTLEWWLLRGSSRCRRGKGRRERPAPLRSGTAVSRKALIPGKRNRPWGSGTAKHPGLLNALLCTEHAGGEQGWESDHLEPFSFGRQKNFRCKSGVNGTSKICARRCRIPHRQSRQPSRPPGCQPWRCPSPHAWRDERRNLDGSRFRIAPGRYGRSFRHESG